MLQLRQTEAIFTPVGRKTEVLTADEVTAIPTLFSVQYSSCLTNDLETCQFQVCSSLDSGQLFTMKPEQKARCATYKRIRKFSVDYFITMVWNVIYIANYKVLNLIQPVETHGFSLSILHREGFYVGNERLFRTLPILSQTRINLLTFFLYHFFANINFPFSCKGSEGMKHKHGFKHPFDLI